MNNYILIITAILLLIWSIFIYRIFDYCLVSPSFISASIFSAGTFIAYFGNKDWNMKISWSIFEVLILAIVSMSIGEYIVRAIHQKRTRILCSYIKTVPVQVIYDISLSLIVALFILGLISDILYYLRLCQIAHVGYADFIGMLSKINLARHQTNERMGIHIACLNVIQSISWGVLTIAYINNCIVLGKSGAKRYKRYLLLWPTYILSVVIGGSRIFFISLIAYILMAYLLISRRYYGYQGNHTTVKRLIKILGISLVGLFILFSFMGQLSGKINDRTNSYDSFLVYTASSIVDLNIYIDSGIIRSTVPGSITFAGLFNTIGRFINIPPNCDVGLGYIVLGTGTLTNVYTAFGSYLADFGWIGLIIIQFILGIVYTCIFIHIENSKFLSLAQFTYFNFLLYGLIGQLFAAETVGGILTVNDIFGIIIYLFIYLLLEQKITYIVE